jgi:hypothetical protein
MYNRTGEVSIIKDSQREEKTEPGDADESEGEVRIL